jgi:hypothetical protein
LELSYFIKYQEGDFPGVLSTNIDINNQKGRCLFVIMKKRNIKKIISLREKLDLKSNSITVKYFLSENLLFENEINISVLQIMHARS